MIPRVFARHEEDVHLPNVGHLGMLFAPDVLRLVADRLAIGMPVPHALPAD